MLIDPSLDMYSTSSLLQWPMICALTVVIASYLGLYRLSESGFLGNLEKSNRRYLPRGPRGLPIVGNLWEMMEARRDGPRLSTWVISLSDLKIDYSLTF